MTLILPEVIGKVAEAVEATISGMVLGEEEEATASIRQD